MLERVKLVVVCVVFIGLMMLSTAWGQSLHDAACKGNITQIEAILAKGANIDIRDKHDLTPVMVAAQCGRFNVVKY